MKRTPVKKIKKSPTRKSGVRRKRQGSPPPERIIMFKRRTDPERFFDIRKHCYRCGKTSIIKCEQNSYNAYMRGEFPIATLLYDNTKLERRFIKYNLCPKCR